jgi:predicted acetyltransferase
MKSKTPVSIPVGYRPGPSAPLSTTLLMRLFIISATITLLMACKKDKENPEPLAEKVLQVNFSASTIDHNLVDSGFAVFKKEGGANQIFKRFDKKPGAMSLSIDDLPVGNWTAEMYIFARFDQSAGRRYRQDKAFTVGSTKEAVNINAPTGLIADSWKPYAFFRHDGQGVSIAVALDNKDPHFDIQVQDTKWDMFYIERYANNRLPGGANAKVAEDIWLCNNGCYTSEKFINNHTAFIPFTQQVGNQEWNNGLIIVVVADNEGADVQFSHLYNK